jgi:DNA-directed RNA polymerase sigma subunit (sigma70/sigma32)
MSPAEVSDLQLIKSIKEENNSTSLIALADRVTGLYISTVSSYSYVPFFERQDMIEHKLSNIYDFAKDYDPNRGMAFSTYVAQRTKWKCLGLINKYPESEEISQDILDEGNNDSVQFLENVDMQQFILDCAEHVDDKRFIEIFKLRHSDDKKKNWKEIGPIMKLSHECVRQIYNKNLEILKNKIKKD